MLNSFRIKALRFINMSEVFIKSVKLKNCNDVIEELIELTKIAKLKVKYLTHIKLCNRLWYFKYKKFELKLTYYLKSGDVLKALRLITYGLIDLNNSLNC